MNVHLDRIPSGRPAVIKKILGQGAIYQRLLEMGLMEGTTVSLIRTAPLGDPIEILVHGYHLSIRKADAALIEVEYE